MIFADNVMVQWLVISLSYDSESYRVLFGPAGRELDMESNVLTSGDNITVTNLSLSVLLTGLKAGTEYDFVLEVNNSAESILSQLQSFRTTGLSKLNCSYILLLMLLPVR